MTVPEIDELFAQALTGDYEDDAPWEAIRALRRIGNRQVFEKAADFCKSAHALSRARGADILGQLGKTIEHTSNSFPEDSHSVISEMVRIETEPQALGSGIAALGHLENPLAVPLIASSTSHPSPDIRFNVAFALGCFPNDPLSVEALISLTADIDEKVRDWATFALGVLGDIDSDEVREALVQRLSDSSPDVREEAMVGLGKRNDPQVLPDLFKALEPPDPTERVIETAFHMLGMDTDREGWSTADYAAALRQRFSL
jgi:HEAT repeat protein